MNARVYISVVELEHLPETDKDRAHLLAEAIGVQASILSDGLAEIAIDRVVPESDEMTDRGLFPVRNRVAFCLCGHNVHRHDVVPNNTAGHQPWPCSDCGCADYLAVKYDDRHDIVAAAHRSAVRRWQTLRDRLTTS